MHYNIFKIRATAVHQAPATSHLCSSLHITSQPRSDAAGCQVACRQMNVSLRCAMSRADNSFCTPVCYCAKLTPGAAPANACISCNSATGDLAAHVKQHLQRRTLVLQPPLSTVSLLGVEQDLGAEAAQRPDGEDVAVVGVGDHAVLVEHAADGLLGPVPAW